MSMSKEDSTQLWNAVQDSLCLQSISSGFLELIGLDDVTTFNAINTKLLNPATPLRHIPLRIYIPQQAEPDTAGSFKIVQQLIPPRTANREF
jgi:autophagy-related protein 5